MKLMKKVRNRKRIERKTVQVVLELFWLFKPISDTNELLIPKSLSKKTTEYGHPCPRLVTT